MYLGYKHEKINEKLKYNVDNETVLCVQPFHAE